VKKEGAGEERGDYSLGWLRHKDIGVFYCLSLDSSLAFQLVSYVTLSDTLVLFEPSKIP
jgi:hypothetical protein